MSRPPRGGRGLKYRIAPDMDYVCQSPPSRGAWIEMHIWWSSWQNGLASPPSRGAWIEIKVDGDRL